MELSLAIAAIKETIILNRNGRFDVWVWFVIQKFKIFNREIEDVLHFRIDFHGSEILRLTRQLQFCLFYVVVV